MILFPLHRAAPMFSVDYRLPSMAARAPPGEGRVRRRATSNTALDANCCCVVGATSAGTTRPILCRQAELAATTCCATDNLRAPGFARGAATISSRVAKCSLSRAIAHAGDAARCMRLLPGVPCSAGVPPRLPASFLPHPTAPCPKRSPEPSRSSRRGPACS